MKVEGGLRIKGRFTKISKPDRPFVSVITVVRNGKNTIAKTIRSVLEQTYDNIEYTIIDGNSEDGTVDIIKGFDDKIAYWVSEPDEGISEAFNKGIHRSGGDLVGMLNSDDWYEPDTVEKVVKGYLKDKEAGVIHGDMRLYEKDKPLFELFPDPNPDHIWFKMIYNHPTCFVAKKCYEKFGVFDRTFKVAMDYELLLRFRVNHIKFIYIREILTNMSFCGNSDRHASDWIAR